MDPLAEKYAGWSSYHYGLNNPVLFIDPNGMEITFSADGGYHATGQEAVNAFLGLLQQENKRSATNLDEAGKLRKVKIVVTNEIVGEALVAGYSHDGGRTEDEYKVPLYKMTITGFDEKGKEQTRSFDVIRFGIQQNKKGKPSVVGLSDEQEYTIKSWNSKYLDGLDDATPGAWRITQGYLIHDGADNPQTTAWGAIGCIEVCGMYNSNTDNFQRLNYLIRYFSGTGKKGDNANNEIASAGVLTISFQKAKRPALERK